MALYRKNGRKKHTALKVLLIILGCLALCAAGIYIIYNAKLDKLDFDHTAEQNPVESEAEPIEELDLGDREIREEAGKLPEGDIFSDSDVVNILLLGTDERSRDFSENARADSMMVISLNKKLGEVKLVSFERGLGVPIEGRNDDWLTHTFRYGGAALTMSTISNCFLLDIDGYVRVNFNTFKQIIDSVGGVDIELSEREAAAIGFSPGLNHLDGAGALKYSRLRSIDDDWHRIVRQRNTVQAVIYQTKHLNLVQLNSLMDTVLPLIRTDLTKSEITSLLLAAPNFMGLTAEQMTIPADGTVWGRIGVDGRSLIDCDFQKNSEILHDFLYGEQNKP